MLYRLCLLSIIPFRLFSQSLSLSPEIPSESYQLGKGIEINLELSLSEKISAKDTSSFEVWEFLPFKKRIIYVPKATGRQVIGPYELEVNSKILRSNSLQIFVVDEKPVSLLELSIPSEVIVGETFELIFRSSDPDFLITNLELKSNKLWRVVNTTSSTEMSIQKGVRTATHTKTYEVTALQPGTLRMDSEAIIGARLAQEKVLVIKDNF